MTEWFAIKYNCGIRGAPVLNGDTLTDDAGNAYTFISLKPPTAAAIGTVTVKRLSDGEYLTVPPGAFDIKLEFETDN